MAVNTAVFMIYFSIWPTKFFQLPETPASQSGDARTAPGWLHRNMVSHPS